MDFMLLPILRMLALRGFSQPSYSISPCPLIQCSCAFASCAATCLLCPVRHCLYCHTRGFASFLLCKGRASVMLQGHVYTCLEKVSKILGCSRSLSKFSAPCRLKFFRASLDIYIPSPCCLLYCT